MNGGKIIHEAILDIDEKEVSLENKQLMNQAGEYKFKIEVYSMNFRGLEIEKEIVFQVQASSEKRTVNKSLNNFFYSTLIVNFYLTFHNFYLTFIKFCSNS